MRPVQALQTLRAFLLDQRNAGAFIPADGATLDPVLDGDGLRSVDPYRLTVLLSVVVAQQQQDIAALAARVAALEVRLP